MRRATIVLAFALPVASLCWRAPKPAADSAPPAAELSVVGKVGGDQPEDFRFELGDTPRLQANGNLAKNIAAEWAKTTAIALYRDGELVAHLRSPLRRDAGPVLQSSFDLSAMSTTKPTAMRGSACWASTMTM